MTSIFAGSGPGISYCAEHVTRTGDRVTMTLRYEASGQSWTQSFSTTSLSEMEIEDQLRQHGFDQLEWFGPQKLWASAIAGDA
jgi:hypothetical protein